MQPIFSRLLTYFTAKSNKKAGTQIKDLFSAVASVIDETEKSIGVIVDQGFPVTANKTYLYRHYGSLYEPEGAQVAVGKVVFFGTVGTVIGKGVELEDQGDTYITMVEDTIKTVTLKVTARVAGNNVTLDPISTLPSCYCRVNGVETLITSTATGITFFSDQVADGEEITIEVDKSDGVPVMAEDVGIAKNRVFNQKLGMVEVTDGIDSSVSVLYITGGRDTEDVEKYRARLLNKLSEGQTPFNAVKIKNKIMEEVPSITNVWIKWEPITTKTPFIKIYCMNASYQFTVEDITAAKKAVEGILPICFLIKDFKFLAPKVVEQTVVIRDIRPSSLAMKEGVIANLKSYFLKADLFEKPVLVPNLDRTINATLANQQNVVSFDLVSGGAAAVDETIYKFGRVDFEES